MRTLKGNPSMIQHHAHPLNPQWTVFGDTSNLQKPFDVAVIMPTIGRPELIRAVQSVYSQDNSHRIQLLIGVDKPVGEMPGLIDLLSHPPTHVTPCLFNPGYSTSVRHGGLHAAKDGGVLRCTLTHLENAEYVAYLDDDNWWSSTHLSALLAAIQGRQWAFSLRWFVHPTTERTVCVDEWESVGPGRGVFTQAFGGFVDPNCLMFNKLACWQCAFLWNIPLSGDERGMSADRNVFHFLAQHSLPGETGNPSTYYAVDPNDCLHPQRLQVMGNRFAEAAGEAASSPS